MAFHLVNALSWPLLACPKELSPLLKELKEDFRKQLQEVQPVESRGLGL